MSMNTQNLLRPSLGPLRTAGQHSKRRTICSTSSRRQAAAAPPKGKRYRETVFSGIQPTGFGQLGNYLGAIQNWIDLQSRSYTSPNPPRILYSIVGLHAITLPQDPKKLREERKDALACLLACGLGPGSKSAGSSSSVRREEPILFFQEDVPEHAELAWYLNTLVGVGRLQRMTTWKSKLSIARPNGQGLTAAEEEAEESLKLGLLAYPVLQAADVMLYKSTIIPVGEDQQQHLELARDIAQTFNHRFGEVFPLPRHVITPSKRVLSLTDPSQKMSKSAPNPNSRILITDPPEVIVKKIRGAVTDSERTLTWDPEERRGVSNLLRILDACQGLQGQGQGVDAAPTVPADQEQDLANETPDDHTIRMSNLTSRLSAEGISSHAQLKSLVSESIIEKLRGIREEYLKVRGDEAYLSSVAQEGRERAREVAGRTMGEVRRKVGLSSI
ncbi:hypothetical protein FFLO_01072 [Filobasidium floriforme]|uniref:tryptophan--tRNA ligase n=1 Tax=Filobasidium floriforme TaxID=5210 RepID=A0A8K0JV95_9TREE|nr:hypothetical protein FFLO_01072 [Filobasidium floriforme]